LISLTPNHQIRNYDITGSIVLYQNSRELVEAAIGSFLKCTLRKKLYLVDNSPTDNLRNLANFSTEIEYIKNAENVGFGTAHNVALSKALNESLYHLVLNPDVYFGEGVLEGLFKYMQANPDVANVMPKILYPDGSVQLLCKLLPSPMHLIARRFLPWLPGAESHDKEYMMVETGYDKEMNVPCLSGCFMFLRTDAIKEVGMFDEKIFLYLEDVDLSRRLHERFRTMFFPGVTAYHHFAKGSYKNFRLMLYNIQSAVIYFNKFGWIFDRGRRKLNQIAKQDYFPNDGKVARHMSDLK
jgi:GT2 family glycosyltransferase